MTTIRKPPRPGIFRFSGYGTTGPQHSDDMRKMLGVRGDLPAQGLPATLLPGVTRRGGQPVQILTWVTPLVGEASTNAYGRRQRRAAHRVRCKCPGCGLEVSAGRLFQHVCDSRGSIRARPLTDQQRKQVLEDFEQWSGGFAPKDCTTEQVLQYVRHGRPGDLPAKKVKDLLLPEGQPFEHGGPDRSDALPFSYIGDDE